MSRISRVPVCDSCLESVLALEGPVCTVCGERLLRAYPAEARCPECVQVEPPYARAVAYGNYSGALRELVHLLKYERVRPAARVLGGKLAAAAGVLAAEFGPVRPLVVPVPLHLSKRRQRGFNQSELIARAAVKHFGKGLALNTSALVRRRATDSQTGLSRPQRRLNMRGAFAVVRPNEIAGRDILLIDDVFTTGTTAVECARVLRRAGCGRVWVVTVARVLKADAALADLPAASDEESDAVAGLARAAHA